MPAFFETNNVNLQAALNLKSSVFHKSDESEVCLNLIGAYDSSLLIFAAPAEAHRRNYYVSEYFYCMAVRISHISIFLPVNLEFDYLPSLCLEALETKSSL